MRLCVLNTLQEAPVDTAFGQRRKTQRVNVGKLLGFTQPLQPVAHGSFATLYQHPHSDHVLIKVTSHKSDVQNVVKAQKLNSDNVVRVFDWDDGAKFKPLPTVKSWALLVEKIDGMPMKYSTSHFYTLAYNGNFELAKDWLDYGGSSEQKEILEAYQTMDDRELSKLSSLFQALNDLSRNYGIDLSDFEDNILDDGRRYVLIDLGF